MRRIFKVAAIAAAVTIAAGGIAFAAVPDSTGTIRGCYSKDSGALRVIDTAKTTTCKSSEKSLNWSQKGPAGPAGTGAASETRAGHCALVLNPLAAATDYGLTCKYTHPFPDKCVYPEVSVTGAYLGDYMSEDGPVWYPGKDFTYWVYGQEGADDSCNANVTSVHIGIHTLHAVPAGNDQATLGFTYIATVPQ